jgi:uncharacterized delta-60 repeat protein
LQRGSTPAVTLTPYIRGLKIVETAFGPTLRAMSPARSRPVTASALTAAGVLLLAAAAVVALGPTSGPDRAEPGALPSVGGSGPSLAQSNLLSTRTGLPSAGVGAGPAVPANPVPPGFGTLDPTFGTRGIVTTMFAGRAVGASDVVLLGDQSIVAVGGALQGNSPDFVLAKYRANGAPDTTFGSGGQVVTPWPAATGANGANGVAVGAGNTIVVVGTTGLGHAQDIGVALARYRADGTLDPTFGTGGQVTTPVGPSGDGGGNAVLAQPDGKVVVAGGATNQNGDADFVAVRYLTNGNLDTSFGNNGVAMTPIPGGDASASAVALQPDGKVVLAGTAIGPAGAGQEFAIVRLTTSGIPDPAFGTSGVVLTQFFAGQSKGGAQTVAIMKDGRIVVGGVGQTTAGSAAFGLMRLSTGGGLDPTFGTGGMVLTEFDGESLVTRVLLRPDGGIVAVGSEGFPSRLALAGYRTDGSLDPAFGVRGRTVSAIGAACAGTSAATQSTGNIVVAGTTAAADFSSGGFALARYLGSTVNIGLG